MKQEIKTSKASEKLDLIEVKKLSIAEAVGFVNTAKEYLKNDKKKGLETDSAKKLLVTQRKILARRKRELKKLEDSK